MNQIITDPIAKSSSILLDPYNIGLSDIDKTLSMLISGNDYADLYFQYVCSQSWGLEEGLVKNGNFSIEKGVGIRTINGENSALAYSDDLSTKSLQNAAQKLFEINRQGQTGVVNVSPKTAQNQCYQYLDPAIAQTSEQKTEILKWADKYAREKSSEIIQVMSSMAMSHEIILIANTENELSADIRPLVRFNIVVIAKRGERIESGSYGGGGRFSLAELSKKQISFYIDKAVDQAITNLESKPAPAGAMTVVLGAGWPGILLHEAVGHGLEGDFTRKGSSVFAGKVGQKVAADKVTVIDEGFIPNRRGSLNIDDEGTPTQINILIENGIVKGFLQDRLNAKLSNVARTGNGRRESYQHLPLPRMTNTYMLGGSHTHDEIIESVKNGIYCESFSGGQVDITNGKFVFSASESWLIEDGKIKYPLKGATLIGDGPVSLKHITMIADNLKLDDGIGTCGKEGQSVPVGVGLPTIRIENMTVGGTEGQ